MFIIINAQKVYRLKLKIKIHLPKKNQTIIKIQKVRLKKQIKDKFKISKIFL